MDKYYNSNQHMEKLGFKVYNSISDAKKNMINSVKCNSDRIVCNNLILNQEFYTDFLALLDSNKRCLNDNSRSLIIFLTCVAKVSSEEDKELILRVIYEFDERNITWGLVVKFAHDYTTQVGISNDFYNAAQDFIACVLRSR